MPEFSRRAFLVRSSVTAAAAGVAVALPAMPAVLTTAETDAPEAADEAGVTAGTMSGPLVAHIKDLSTGEMSIFSGTSEITTRDPQLAARILRAAG